MELYYVFASVWGHKARPVFMHVSEHTAHGFVMTVPLPPLRVQHRTSEGPRLQLRHICCPRLTPMLTLGSLWPGVGPLEQQPANDLEPTEKLEEGLV